MKTETRVFFFQTTGKTLEIASANFTFKRLYELCQSLQPNNS